VTVLNQHYELLINTAGDYSSVKEKSLKKAISQLPGISFTALNAHSSPLQNPDLLLKGKELYDRAESLSTKSEKSALLDETFNLYKNFIKLNRSQIYQREMRDACMEALFVGTDLINSLETKEQREALQLSLKKIQVISGYSSALHTKSLNQTLDALNVPQKCFAVSSQPMGTTNVRDCLFLVLRNRITHSTFAAHIDRNTDADSISEAITHHVAQSTPIDSYMIGAHLSEPTISENILVNIPKVSRILLGLSKIGYHFDSRWCILRETTPINIVYYPKENQFFEAVPGRELSSYSSNEILVHLDSENNKLLPFFLDEEKTFVCLSSSVQKKLLKMLDCEGEFSKAKVLEEILNGLPTSLRTYTQIKAISKAYSEALKSMFLIVKKQLPYISYANFQTALVQVLKDRSPSLYILPFSSEKNGAFIAELQNVLFESTTVS